MFKPSIVIVLVLIILAIAQSNAAGPEVEKEVLELLKKYEWVPVIVKIHFNNNLNLDLILQNLSDEEFILKEKLLRGDGFAGNLSQKGLDKLSENKEISYIYWDRVAYTIGDDSSQVSIGQPKKELVIVILLAIIFLVLFFIYLRRRKT